jgi:hypothetical protein
MLRANHCRSPERDGGKPGFQTRPVCFAFCEYRPMGGRIERQARGAASDSAPVCTKILLDTDVLSMFSSDSTRPAGVA